MSALSRMRALRIMAAECLPLPISASNLARSSRSSRTTYFFRTTSDMSRFPAMLTTLPESHGLLSDSMTRATSRPGDSPVVIIHNFEMKYRDIRLRDATARGLALHDNGTVSAVCGTVDLMRHARCRQRAEERVSPRALASGEAGAVQQTCHGPLP